MALALFEMKLVLATLLRQYDLELSQAKLQPDRPIRPARRGITFVPPGHLRLTVTGKRLLLPTPVR